MAVPRIHRNRYDLSVAQDAIADAAHNIAPTIGDATASPERAVRPAPLASRLGNCRASDRLASGNGTAAMADQPTLEHRSAVAVDGLGLALLDDRFDDDVRRSDHGSSVSGQDVQYIKRPACVRSYQVHANTPRFSSDSCNNPRSTSASTSLDFRWNRRPSISAANTCSKIRNSALVALGTCTTSLTTSYRTPPDPCRARCWSGWP